MNNPNVLKGTIDVTDNLGLVQSIPDTSVRIISLDEENRISPNNPNVIIGTCLLPPMEALIAEVDGDEDLYDIHYINHLNSPYVQEFIGALISALYKGMSLLLYAPMMNENISIRKLRQHLWSLYGIMIGVAGLEPCSYDPRCVPIWLTMMYSANVIYPEEFLLYYPEDASINRVLIDKLMVDMRPVGNCYDDRFKVIKKYQHSIKKNPKTQMAIIDLRFE